MSIENGLKMAVLACALAVIVTGCATNAYPGGPTVGAAIYVDVTSPAQMLTVATDANARPVKTGRATSRAILGIAATGDGGLNAAMENGGITKVHHVDHNIQLYVYGFFVSDTVIVHGE